MQENSKEYLYKLGCCTTCIEVFHGTSDCNIKEHIKEEDKLQDVTGITCHKELYQDEIEAKRIKPEICTACLGLLKEGINTKAIQTISDKVMQENHDADEFSLYISLPVCLQVRISIIWAHLSTLYPEMRLKDYRSMHMPTIKTLWRTYMGDKIGVETGKRYIHGNENFRIDVTTMYADDEEDCKVLEKLCQTFAIRRQQHRRYDGKVFTRNAVEQALCTADDKAILSACPNLLKEPTKPLEIEDVVCSQASIYFAGRYCKYSRELPQTPWVLDGIRRFNISVEEMIVNPIKKCIQADGIKFSSSGREDVDVRCLGNGRPFVLEFSNPKRTTFNQDEVTAMMNVINLRTKDVRVKDFQLTSRKNTSQLKLGEEEKTKSYCALCIVKEGYCADTLSKLTVMKELTIHQTTPLRVLHRRSLKVRDRIIFNMEVVPIDKYFFKLYLTTQAGTYIKEFVHGDFGRTVPNLGTLLNTPVDIIALDVENVQLDWPPAVKYE